MKILPFDVVRKNGHSPYHSQPDFHPWGQTPARSWVLHTPEEKLLLCEEVFLNESDNKRSSYVKENSQMKPTQTDLTDESDFILPVTCVLHPRWVGQPGSISKGNHSTRVFRPLPFLYHNIKVQNTRRATVSLLL